MKTIFVYGILRRNHSAESFGLKDFVGEATLLNYKRVGTSLITYSEGDIVEGEVFRVSDSLEEKINGFESRFGYTRKIVHPILKDSNKSIEAIAYLYY